MLFVFNGLHAFGSLKLRKLILNIPPFFFLGALASIALPAMSEPIFVEDFSSFTGSGFAPNPSDGLLDSNLFRVTGLSDGDGAFAETYIDTNGDFARGSSSGGVTTGGIYAFDVGNDALASNTALGIQQTGGDFTPGNISLRLVNQSFSIVNVLEVLFDLYEWNDQGRSSLLEFEYALVDETSYNSLLKITTTEEADKDVSWQKSIQSVSLQSLNWQPMQALYFRWSFSDWSGSRSRDELAIDNIRITEAEAIAEPSMLVIFSFGLLMLVMRSYGSKSPGD